MNFFWRVLLPLYHVLIRMLQLRNLNQANINGSARLQADGGVPVFNNRGASRMDDLAGNDLANFRTPNNSVLVHFVDRAMLHDLQRGAWYNRYLIVVFS